MEFKVGDKVKIIENTYYRTMDEYVGYIGKITQIGSSGNYYVDDIKTKGGIDAVWYKEELELVQGEEFIDNKAALKLAIDGYKVRCKDWNDGKNTGDYIVFDGMHFRYTDEKRGVINVMANSSVNRPSDRWEVVLPQPKFTLNQFVSNFQGDIAKIVEVKQEKCEYAYMTIFNVTRTNNLCKYKEDELTAV
jgi:hypothetical protein